jgi:hypothetical protein
MAKMTRPNLSHRLGLGEFLYGITDQKRQERLETLLSLEKEHLQAEFDEIMAKLEKEQTTQVIFGANQENLQYFVSRGWKVHRFADGLSLKEEHYQLEDKSQQDSMEISVQGESFAQQQRRFTIESNELGIFVKNLN